jgi:hypothetical protein
MRPNDGGAAFPALVNLQGGYVQIGRDQFRDPGMSLRDYFAASAMVRMINDPAVNSSSTDIAECAYVIADAMLAERVRSSL